MYSKTPYSLLQRYLFYALTILLALNVNTIYAQADRQKEIVQARGQPEAKSSHDYNVIIVSLDALRADHVGCYGYSRNTTPNIDALAKNGVLFEWAFAQSNFTLPSHASLFTSKYVHNHKTDRIERRLSDNEFTLAKVLKKNNYKTAAFIYNAPQLDPSFGLNQGFDTYFFGTEKNRAPSFEKTMPQALAWIKQHKDDKFFVFLHSNDIHEPYNSPFENFFDPDYKGHHDNQYFATVNDRSLTRSVREIEHIIAHYDGGIKYADTFIDGLIQRLKDWGLLDRTIIILLSDHGEILADRRMGFYHGFSLHDEEVHVPLIIVHPRTKEIGIRVNSQVQLIDVMPTVLDFLGIKGDNIGMDGRSLVDVIERKEGKDFNKYVYAECISGGSDKEGVINRQVMVKTSSWKLISSVWIIKENIKKTLPKTITMHTGPIISLPQEDGYELYNLKEDPKEKKNIIDEADKAVTKELLNKLLSFY